MARRTALPWIDCEWNPVVVRDLNVHLCPETLCVPLRWRKPRLALIGNCGDLFLEAVPDDCIAHVFAVMQSSAAHTFRIHTQHPERMATLLRRPMFWDAVTDFGVGVMKLPPAREQLWPDTGRRHGRLPNVRLGVGRGDLT